MPLTLNFTFVPDIYISGLNPNQGLTGDKFEITGSGLCYATSGAFKSPYDNDEDVTPFTFETGLGYNGDFCVLTGTIPDIPHNDYQIQLYGPTSTGTFDEIFVRSKIDTCFHECNVIITGDLTVSGDFGLTGDMNLLNVPIDNFKTGFLVVDDAAGGLVSVRQVQPASITGFNPAAILISAGSGLIGGGDLTVSRTIDAVAGTGIYVSEDSINIDTGVLVTTGQGWFNVAPGPGLTGDHKVYLGGTLDLGVFVDNETIKFTGVSGTEIGAFTVVDGGITPEKVSFGFAGSNTKSGAANSVSGYISGGLGFNDFVWSGDSKFTLEFYPTGHPYLQNLVYKTGDQIISGEKHFRDTVRCVDIEVSGLLTATGTGDSRGIFVSNLRVTGNVSGVMAAKSLAVSGNNTTDRFSTSEVFSDQPVQSEGLEIFDMAYTAQATGNYLILDVELNVGTSDNADAIVCIFKDDEENPIRGWTHNVYAPNYGQVFNMKYFIQSPDTDLHNYKVKIGRRPTNGWSPIVYVNRLKNYPTSYPYASGYFGNAAVSSFLISEIKPHPTGSRW
mgnify:CR=1 FL=1|jgi:hypothetical protein|tara:strand:- start:775 stop:2448 length:1674 start_codon:yes stop_codon:yes gene_type:complete